MEPASVNIIDWLIDWLKILTGRENVDAMTLSCSSESMSDRELRGHKLKIFNQPCKKNIRKYFFTQRIINEWMHHPSILSSLDWMTTRQIWATANSSFSSPITLNFKFRDSITDSITIPHTLWLAGEGVPPRPYPTVTTDDILTPAIPCTHANHPYKFRNIRANTTVFRNSFFVNSIPAV